MSDDPRTKEPNVVDTEKRQADRLRVLKAIYDVSMGSGTTTVAGSQLLEDLGLSDHDLADACNWLEGEGFIQAVRTMWGHATPYIVLITHRGIKQIECDRDDNSAAEKRQADRLRVLKAIYDVSIGSETTMVSGSQLLEDLGLSDHDLADACDWLEAEQFIKSVRVTWGHRTPYNLQITHRGIKEMEQGSEDIPAIPTQITQREHTGMEQGSTTAPIVTAQIGLEEITHLIQITHVGIEEIKRAMQEPRQSTDNFPAISLVYVGGNVSDSAIQSGSPRAQQEVSSNSSSDLAPIREFLRQLDASAAELNLPSEDAAELAAEIETLKAQINSPKPKHHIIKESLTSVRTILEITSGSVAAVGLLDTLQHLHL